MPLSGNAYQATAALVELAETHAAAALASATTADTNKNAATAAAEASGDVNFYNTKALANTALAALSEGQVIEVFADESRGGRRTRYRKETGAYVHKVTFKTIWIDVVADHLADNTGATDAGTEINAAIAAASAAGGGIVHAPAGDYLIEDFIVMADNVMLLGEGDATRFIGKAGVYTTKNISGVDDAATILMNAVTNCVVRRLYIDHDTNGTDANCIKIGEVGTASKSSNVVVEECKILGFDTHQYLIYSKDSNRVRVLNNDVQAVSGAITTQDLNCIEIFGGLDVLVQGNRCTRGNAGILVKTELGIASPAKDVRVIGNHCEGNLLGIELSAGEGQAIEGVIILGNTVKDCPSSAGIGIKLGVANSSTLRNCLVSSNTVKEAGRNCIETQMFGGDVSGVAIINNIIQQSTNNDGYVALVGAENVMVSGNVMHTGGAVGVGPFYGLSVVDSDNVKVVGNLMNGSRRRAVHVTDQDSACDNISVENNTLQNYDNTDAGDHGVVINSNLCTNVSILANRLKPKTANLAAPLNCLNAGTGLLVKDNTFGFTPSIVPVLFPTATVTLANGSNHNVVVPDDGRAYLIIGPTAAFNISGFAAPYDGRRITLVYSGGFNATLDYATGSAAGNQIVTGASGSVTATGEFTATFQYNAHAGYWYLVGYVG